MPTSMASSCSTNNGAISLFKSMLENSFCASSACWLGSISLLQAPLKNSILSPRPQRIFHTYYTGAAPPLSNTW